MVARRVNLGLVKLALKRDDTPAGTVGRMHLDCPCGTAIDIPPDDVYDRAKVVTCQHCGQAYDCAGWLRTN